MAELTQAVYLDSPIISALHQIKPFFEDGVFGATDTPVLMRMRPMITVQSAFSAKPKNLIIHNVRPGRLPMADGAVLFYPYNSLSNMKAVTNRNVHHVLTLHGESNKSASNRPAARLYDYICAAGPLARDRYLDAGIFTKNDADQGRIILMGDSFVQSFPWFQRSTNSDDDALLYCPTWEGYGGKADNFSSITDLSGFDACKKAARALGVQNIVVKPHPYLGLLEHKMYSRFVKGVRALVDDGFTVNLALSAANLPLNILCRALLANVPRVDETNDKPILIRMGICDVSGMEAVFLKQRVPHMVMLGDAPAPINMIRVYQRKAIRSNEDVGGKALSYSEASDDIDEQHRNLAFGWHDPALATMSGSERRAWLIHYTQQDPFWRHKQRIEQ